MKIIRISGVIADWQMESEENVTPAELKKSLDLADGEAVLFLINSPGGSVFHGLEMFSMIKNYPGKTETRVTSLAASMGSVLALAGDVKSVEESAMYFIHNAWGGAIGDYREMRKYAQWLEDITSLLASMYEKHTSLSFEEARKLMDDDTQFFGESLVNLGFKSVDDPEPVDRAFAKVNSVARLKECSAKLSEEQLKNDLEKVAASINGGKFDFLEGSQNSNQPAANAGKNKTEENITVKNIAELKAQFPDLYAEAVKAGVDQERDRVKAHITMGETAGAIDLAVKNIKEGADFTQAINAEYMAEGFKNRDINDRNDDEPEGDLGADSSDDADDEAEQAAYEAKLAKKRGKK